MQRCPCCNARLKQVTCCPRCKTDLHDLIKVQRLAKLWYGRAIECYLHGQLQDSLEALNRSLQLKHSDSALLFRTFIQERLQHRAAFPNLQGYLQTAMSHSASLVKRLLDNFSAWFDVMMKQHF